MSSRACLAACALAAVNAGAAEPAIPLDAARAVFAEAAVLCAADGGRLWAVDLCGPVLLVDPATHAVAASRNDAQGTLHDAGGVFTGMLPANRDAGDTGNTGDPDDSCDMRDGALDWGGVRWARLTWPLPEEAAARAVRLMHAAFHRAHPAPPPAPTDAAHLDTLDGRYLLRLEWRALATALEATGERAARSAAEDALRFRHERRQLYPGAADAEVALELDEGLAEYTGLALGLATPDARTAAALRGLSRHEQDADFARVFADASTPAYGLLLDRFAPGWQRNPGPGAGLDVRLLTALRIDRTAESAAQVGRRAARYGGDELLESEIARDARRRSEARAADSR
jgi:hypothetical protein